MFRLLLRESFDVGPELRCAFVVGGDEDGLHNSVKGQGVNNLAGALGDENADGALELEV